MKIELINQTQYDRILEIQKQHPKLTFNNKGYEYINKSELSEEDNLAFQEVTDILKDHIIGFSEFNNFQYVNDTIRLRFQYDYGADDNSTSFTGVGYIELDELLKGFITKEKEE